MAALKILISHYHEEKGLAQAWAKLLGDVSGDGIECWFSSDLSPQGGMVIGDEWRDKIYEKLKECQAVVAVQSPTSNGRPWVVWECGLASGVDKERGIIPLVFSMAKADLTSPLGTYQVYSGDEKTSVREVCARLMDKAGLKLRDEVFDIYFATYSSSIILYKPRRPVSREAFDLWLNRFEALLESGRASEIPAKRDEMYSNFPKPFVPQNVKVHEFLSKVMLDLRLFNEAIFECNYGLGQVPDDSELLHRKALSLVESGDPAGALTTLEELFHINNDLRNNPELATLEGRINRERWNVTSDPRFLEAALSSYTRVASNYPDPYYPCVNAGELALMLGNKADAEIWFTKALEICKNQSETRTPSFWVDFTAGQSFIGLNRLSDAFEAYKVAIEKKPSPRAKSSALSGASRTAVAAGLSQNDIRDIVDILS